MIRERREELVIQIPMPGSSGAGVAGEQVFGQGSGLPRDLPLTQIGLMVEGRWNVTVAAGTVLPEAPVSLVRQVQLLGTKVTGGGSIQLINISGEELAFLTEMYNQYTPLGIRRQPLSVPGSTFPNPGAAVSVGNFDFRFFLLVPIAPFYATHEDEIAGILDPSIFSQLDLRVRFGDSTAFTAGAVTATFSGFGSASGVPTVTVFRFSPLAANLPINQYHYTLLSRQFQWGNFPASGTDTLIGQLQVGNKIRGLLLRQYAQSSTVPKLMTAARVGDGIAAGIFRYRVKLNGAEKFRMRNVDIREVNAKDGRFRQELLQGYALIDWASRGFLEDIFDTRGFGATATRFELFSDFTGMVPATDALDVTQIEQVKVEV